MDIFEATTEEELKQCGKIRDIRHLLSELFEGNIKIKSNSWTNIFNGLLALKKIYLVIQETASTAESTPNNSTSNSGYFKGEAEKYIFYLLELDGKSRLDKLGVKKTHYSNKDKANKWRNEIAKIIHPDVCLHSEATKAMEELNEMYKEMIK